MVKAVIFDMDGVISDTQKFHAETESMVLAKYGINLEPYKITTNYAGITDEEMFTDLFQQFKIQTAISVPIEEKWNIMKNIVRGNISAIPGAISLIELLKTNGFKLGIASSSPLNFIEFVISELKIKEKFDAITSAEEVEQGKPHPSVFLLAAQKLDISPKECIVIEDGKSGMIAAKRAGMKCIGLVDKDTIDRSEYPADIIVKDLGKLKLEDFE